MQDQHEKQRFDELVEKVEEKARKDEAAIQSIQAAPASARRFKQALAALLAVAAIIVLAVQAPRMSEPFPGIEGTHPESLAIGDLEYLAGFIDTFQVAQGRYPEDLGQIRLPDDLKDLVGAGSTIRYARTADGFRLDWAGATGKVSYDSKAGRARFEPSR